MPSQILWDAAAVSRGNVLSTELNSLGAGSRTARGTSVNNNTNLDTFAAVEINVTFGTAPAAGGFLGIRLLKALDGTNFEDGSASVDPGIHTLITTVPVRATTNAQLLMSRRFKIDPCVIGFILVNNTSVAFPASGSTVELFTFNYEGQ
jgi:hypothetical protein